MSPIAVYVQYFISRQGITLINKSLAYINNLFFYGYC